jgi:hypothetical protein
MIVKTEFLISCTNTDKHNSQLWVNMNITQIELDRRICAVCPVCKNSIAICLKTTIEDKK